VRREGNVVGVRNFRKLTPEEPDGVFRDPRKLKAVKDEAKFLCYRGLNAIMISSADVNQRPSPVGLQRRDHLGDTSNDRSQREGD
jgi:hypothetical protein